MFTDLLFLTLRSLRYRSLRSWLTVTGVVIGIMLVVMILALGSGVQNSVARLLQGFGSNLVFIYPGEPTNPFVSLIGGVKFKEADITALASIPGVESVVPMDQSFLNAEFKGEKKTILVVGGPARDMYATFESSQGIRIAEGRWLASDSASEVVLGYLAYKELFAERVRIDDELIIKSKRFKIVGYVGELGSHTDDNQVYVSLPYYRQLTGIREGVMSGLVKVAPTADPNRVVQEIRFALSKQDTVRDFSVMTIEKAGRIVGDILGIIELALVVIALMSLVVGAVGIMNTMYTSVLERTKHIGILKAVGASYDAILSLFLIEAGIVGLVGGVLGTALGIGLAYVTGVVAASLGYPGLFSFASLDLWGIAAVLAVTFVVGILSGVLPARQAARMEPAEALRYE